MDFYTVLSQYYDDVFKLNNDAIDLIASSTKHSGNILDMACGTGTDAVALKRSGFNVFPFDLDGNMIEKAKNKDRELDFKVLDMLDIDKAYDPGFDSAFCFGNSIVHLDSKDAVKKVFKKVFELLDAKGVFLLQNINFDRILKFKVDSLPTIINKEKDISFKRTYLHENHKILFKGTLEVSGSIYEAGVDLLPLLKEDIEEALDFAG